MAESQTQVGRSLQLSFSPSKSTVPLRVSTLPCDPQHCAETSRSFPAFRLKKSYWPRGRSANRTAIQKVAIGSNLQFPNAIFKSLQRHPSPHSPSGLTTKREREGRLYDSLRKLKRPLEASTNTISWRPKPLAHLLRHDPEVSTVDACRNMYLSFDSQAGRYNVKFREDVESDFRAKLLKFLTSHRRKQGSPPVSKKPGRLRLATHKSEKIGGQTLGGYMLDIKQQASDR